MVFANLCSFYGEVIPLNLYWPSVNPRPSNICVSSVSVKCSKI